MTDGASGHRALPHTADMRIEAWAPTREGCLAEAVAGLVESFADLPPGTPATSERLVPASGPTHEDALVAVLDEVIYILDTDGSVPVHAEPARSGGGPGLRLHLAPIDAAEPVGATPKAVTLHDLRFGPRAGGWSCAVTVDV